MQLQGEVKQVVLQKNGDLYLDAEFVDNSVADNEEMKFTFVNDDVKKAVINDLVNKPYVLTEKIYHPDYTELDPQNKLSASEWLKKYYAWQEKWAIGRIRKVFEAGKGIWRGWIHITNSAAKEAYLQGKIPKKVSIGFFADEGDYKHENGIYKILKAVGLHVAAVINPAWKNAVIRNECIGDDSCMSKVYQAGIESLDCGFCVKTVLNNLKPEDCFDPWNNNSNSPKLVFHGSRMKLDLSKLSDEEKEELKKALLGQSKAETEQPEPTKPEEPEKPTGEEGKKIIKNKAPISTPEIPTPQAPTNEQADDKQTIAKLQKQVADLLKKDAERDEITKKEDQARKQSVVESFLTNEQDEEMKKVIMEKAMALPSIDDVKFWLSLKYAQAIEVTTGRRGGKVAHAGVLQTEIPESYIDPRAILKAKKPTQPELNPSVYAFGMED